MSFDPFHEQQPLRDPAPDLTPADIPATGGSHPPPGSSARERLLFPAILLIIVGVLNFLFAAPFCVLGAIISPALVEQFFEQVKNDPNQSSAIKEAFEKANKETTPEEMARRGMVQYLGIGITNLLTMFLTIFAGVRMLQLRSYGLALLGSIVSAVPCVSGSACCCLGEVAGVYAIIMLLQPDIRDAFR